jgi:hypothetical protein
MPISWTAYHIAAHWRNAALAVQGLPFERQQPPADGTPPDFSTALGFLQGAASELNGTYACLDRI